MREPGIPSWGARLLFAGDSITRSVLLQLPDSLPVRRYAENMRRLFDLSDSYDLILSGHSADPLPVSLLRDIVTAADAIVAGDLRGTPEMTRFGESLVARLGEAVINYKEDRIE